MSVYVSDIDKMTMWDKPLSKFQAIPVIGPLIGSPFKAIVSTIQMVVFVALGISLTLLSQFLRDKYREGSFKIMALGIDGFNQLMYSIFNIATLGILGYIRENGCGCLSSRNIKECSSSDHPSSEAVRSSASTSEQDSVSSQHVRSKAVAASH